MALGLGRLGIRRRFTRLLDQCKLVASAVRSALRLTDYTRWRRNGQETPVWDDRNDIIGSLVRDGASVLDIGCGAQTLRSRIPSTCSYQPCDIVEHEPGVWVWNFNKGPFPHLDRHFDYVVSSGVMEYARDPKVYLQSLAGLGEEVLLSYATLEGVPSAFDRRASGWFNDLEREELEGLFRSLGLNWEHIALWQTQDIYRLSAKALAPLPAKARRTPLPRATVCGSFGFANAGDEGAWMAVEDIVADAGLEFRVDKLTRFTKPHMDNVIGIGPADRMRRIRLVGNPIVYVGGGVVDPSVNCVLLSTESLLGSLRPPDYSLIGINVEASTEYPPAVAERLRRLLEKARIVTVRDELSAQVVRKLAPAIHAEVSGDVVLCLRATRKGLPEAVTRLGRHVAISLAPRWADDQAFYDWVVPELARLARELRCALVFVPCATHFDDDRPVHAKVAAGVRALSGAEVVEVVDHLDARQTMGIFSGAMATVGMRLHACVMSYASRVPTVGLAYHSKLHGFARTIGASAFFLPKEIPAHGHAINDGYTFAESGLLGTCIVDAVQAAMSGYSFDKLEAFRQSTRAALSKALTR